MSISPGASERGKRLIRCSVELEPAKLGFRFIQAKVAFLFNVSLGWIGV